MSDYRATVEWHLQGEFKYATYSRAHSIDFDHGIRLPGNAGLGNVPKTVHWTPGADPEQQFVASLSTCHMLWFLDIARRAGFVVDAYEDQASGVMGKDDRGKIAITQVKLNPQVLWGGAKQPAPEEVRELHHKAHEACFIANSFRGDIAIGGGEAH